QGLRTLPGWHTTLDPGRVRGASEADAGLDHHRRGQAPGAPFHLQEFSGGPGFRDPRRRGCRCAGTSPRHQFFLGPGHRVLVYQEDQGFARERLHHGGTNRPALYRILTRRRPAARCRGAPAGSGDTEPYLVMSTSLVSFRKKVPITKVISATTIGYHRPE